MRTAKWFALLSTAGWISIGCTDDIAAPGACPQFCPDAVIEVRDTLLTNVVERDSSYFGYVLPHVGTRMPVTNPGAGIRSLAAVEFLRFGLTIADGTGQFVGVSSIDSFRVTVRLVGRSAVTGLELVLHRIPVGLDSTLVFADLADFFEDSTIIGTVAIGDSVTTDSIVVTVPATAFPAFAADSQRAAVALEVRGDPNAFAAFGSQEAGTGSLFRRFVTDSAGVERSDARATAFDTFLRSGSPALPADGLLAGESPSARSLLRFNLPPAIIDSATVVGAQLILVPIAASQGAPGDTISLQANGLSADFGAKSPLVLIVGAADADSVGLPAARVPVGSMDTVFIDVTPILRNWQSTPNRPHSIVIRVTPEGSSIGTVFFGGSSHPTAAPSIRITYINPFRFES